MIHLKGEKNDISPKRILTETSECSCRSGNTVQLRKSIYCLLKDAFIQRAFTVLWLYTNHPHVTVQTTVGVTSAKRTTAYSNGFCCVHVILISPGGSSASRFQPHWPIESRWSWLPPCEQLIHQSVRFCSFEWVNMFCVVHIWIIALLLIICILKSPSHVVCLVSSGFTGEMWPNDPLWTPEFC